MRRYQAAGHLGADADPEDAAKAMVGLIPGFILQRLMLGDVTADGFTRGVRHPPRLLTPMGAPARLSRRRTNYSNILVQNSYDAECTVERSSDH
ncbi:hypothetical protein [Georgenia sp. SUBG003]|uniref:hypothetical protein n=1 Tax=Georgenia sp. SUBG003 TaxID=1497974 RepID=UPI003AB55B81